MDNPICCHPELGPMAWELKRPEPCEMLTCECGQNATCPICGYGWGGLPCGCSRRAEVSKRIDRILGDYADIWEELAKV